MKESWSETWNEEIRRCGAVDITEKVEMVWTPDKI
jgi:hypothetical protein